MIDISVRLDGVHHRTPDIHVSFNSKYAIELCFLSNWKNLYGQSLK